MCHAPSSPAVEGVRVVAPPPPPSMSSPPVQVRDPIPITDEMRRKGIHECNPPDPLGLGPYAPYRHVTGGRIAIPQRGGHTSDWGFDVLVHFHGGDPTRKTVVQVARGVVYVAIDKGVGSGAYANAFQRRDKWPNLKTSITNALRAQTGDERAHIRHLGLSAWSAGYGAVNQIIKQDADGVDAVVLLDSLHGSWKFGTTARDHDRTSSVDLGYIAPLVGYARRAQRGEKLFVLTHSRIDPKLYPGVGITADALLERLGAKRKPSDARFGMLSEVGAVDVEGLHVWSFDGRNERAHCAHISLIAPALHLVEAAWDTPAMDREVTPTPAPELGGGDKETQPRDNPGLGFAGAPGALDSVGAPRAPDSAGAPGAPDSVGAAPAASKRMVDTGGLTPQPLAPSGLVRRGDASTAPPVGSARR